MLGRKACLLLAGALLLAWLAPAAYADQTLLSGQQYQMTGRDIIVHIVEVKIVDRPMSNIVPQPNMTYYQLVYNFENTGDTTDKGFVQPIFVDSNGNPSRYMDYTSETVLPHHTSNNYFLEMPEPKGTVITKIVFVEGFDRHEILIPSTPPTVTPAGPTGTPPPSATPSSGGSTWRDCLPLIPFAMVFGLAGVGMVINRCGIKKH